MPLLSRTEVLRLKLSSIPAPLLRTFSSAYGINLKKVTEIIKELLDRQINISDVDHFINDEYGKILEEKESNRPKEQIISELHKVDRFEWGVVQGQLDGKIQRDYVRKFWRYDQVLREVENHLYESVRDYVICTWYNHWSSVILEDLISIHSRVVPTLKNVKGIDLFFDGQPFDLKVTYVPRDYNNDVTDLQRDPKTLAVWLYENQGAQRFGSDNRFFVVLHDVENPQDSWKIKRDIDFVGEKINRFLDNENVSEEDQIAFTFGRQTYTAITKVLLIFK
jgi:hypothetical protein